MNHFQAILAQVRMVLSSQQPRQVQALLDSLLEEELLSREYHCALLREPDGEALARKISLTLLEKGDLGLACSSWVCSRLQDPVVERATNYRGHGGKPASLGVKSSDVWPAVRCPFLSEREICGQGSGQAPGNPG